MDQRELLLTRWVLAEGARTGREPSTAQKARARAYLRSLPDERVQQMFSVEEPPQISLTQRRPEPQSALPTISGQIPRPVTAAQPAEPVGPADLESATAPTAGPPPVAPGASGGPLGPEIPAGLRAVPTGPAEIEGYIRQAAQARGIDPEVAIRAANAEGGTREPARRGTFATGSSWWPFQLHYGGKGTPYESLGTTAGMGNSFTKETGWQPGDPAAWRASVDYALDAVAKNGWGAFYGPQAVGITGKIGVSPDAQPLGVDPANLPHGVAQGQASQIARPQLPPITGDMLSDPVKLAGAMTDTMAEAEAQIAALSDNDPFAPEKIRAITSARDQQLGLLQYYQSRADKQGYEAASNAIAQGHLAIARGQLGVAQAGLAEQSLGREQDLRLALLQMAQQDDQFQAHHQLDTDRFALEKYRADLEEESLVGIQTGFFRGERTVAGQTLDQQIAAEANRIKSEFTRMQAEGATALGGAESAAQKLRLEAAPWAFGPGQQYVLGREPGGVGERLGMPTRGLEIATPFFPNAGVETVRGGVQAALAAHPGNPLSQFAGV